MTEPPDADPSDLGRAVSSDELISAGPNDLVVLHALGKRRRMAKTIRQTSDGGFLVEPHDGRNVFHVADARTLSLTNILQAGRGLASVADDEFVVRAAIRSSASQNYMRRLLRPKDGRSATLAEVPRAYVFFDVDGADLQVDFDPHNQEVEEDGTPASFIRWEASIDAFIHESLPTPFYGADCWWQFIASMGFKPGLHMRLLFLLERPTTKDELKRWMGPRGRQHKLDPAMFHPAQQILVAPPILKNGAADPIRYRCSWLTGLKHVVTPPTASEIAAMADTQPRRRIAAPLRLQTERSIKESPRRSFAERITRIGDGLGRDGFHNGILAAIGT